LLICRFKNQDLAELKATAILSFDIITMDQ